MLSLILINIILIFCQITKKFDEVLALASAPRPDGPRRIHFGCDELESATATEFYNRHYIVENLKSRDPVSEELIDHLTYSDILHVIVAAFQNQPLSMEYYAMKRVLAEDLELKELPEGLKLKAEKVSFSLLLLDKNKTDSNQPNVFRASSLVQSRFFHLLTSKAGTP